MIKMGFSKVNNFKYLIQIKTTKNNKQNSNNKSSRVQLYQKMAVSHITLIVTSFDMKNLIIMN
jgi:hypothetical protein